MKKRYLVSRLSLHDKISMNGEKGLDGGERREPALTRAGPLEFDRHAYI